MRRVVLLSIAMVAACGGSTSEGTGAPSPGSSSGSSGASGAPSANASSSCDAPSADVAVSQADTAGYPSYAVSGCSLVYKSPSGVLVFRDLATGAEEELSGTHQGAKRPSASPEVIAWEAEDGGPSYVVVRVRATGETKTLSGAFVGASEPRVSGTSVVFTAWVTASGKSSAAG